MGLWQAGVFQYNLHTFTSHAEGPSLLHLGASPPTVDTALPVLSVGWATTHLNTWKLNDY